MTRETIIVLTEDTDARTFHARTWTDGKLVEGATCATRDAALHTLSKRLNEEQRISIGHPEVT